MAKSAKLFVPKRRIVARSRERRVSRHERGYDFQWEKIAQRHSKVSPLCIECERAGRMIVMRVVDHKIPVRDRPDLRLDPKNRWSLCHECHNGWKRRIEGFARATGQIDKLIMWCDDPATRPSATTMRRPKKVREPEV